MKFLISDLDKALLIALGVGILLGIIFFLITGTYRVKKNHVIIIEKLNEFYKICESGWHFYLPIKYRRVGYYNIAEQSRVITLGEVKKIILTYKIIDVKKYHYSGSRIENYVEYIRKNNSEITEELLTKELEKIGIKYISVR